MASFQDCKNRSCKTSQDRFTCHHFCFLLLVKEGHVAKRGIIAAMLQIIYPYHINLCKNKLSCVWFLSIVLICLADFFFFNYLCQVLVIQQGICIYIKSWSKGFHFCWRRKKLADFLDGQWLSDHVMWLAVFSWPAKPGQTVQRCVPFSTKWTEQEILHVLFINPTSLQQNNGIKQVMKYFFAETESITLSSYSNDCTGFWSPFEADYGSG